MDLKDINKETISNHQSSVSQTSNSQQRQVGWVLGIGILFMPYFFSWLTLRKGYSTGARLVALGWAFLIIGVMNNENNNNRSSANVSAEKEEAKLQFISESCNQLSHAFGASSQLSDIQKKELWKKFDSKGFEWDLVVTEVSERSFGSGYQVQFKCTGSNSFIQDIIVYYPKSAKDSIMNLRKKSAYKVSGKLSDYNSLLGLTADAI